MNQEVEACSECVLNCMLCHWKESSPSPLVSSFFKVMFGKQFSNFLIVPPKFARTISSLIGKKTSLEDSSGKQWQVVISKVNGAVAFLNGWYKFSQDHGIELGDFLVFHYIKESHFIVQIYGKSACEKSTSCGEKVYHNKRVKTIRDSATASCKESLMLDCSNPCDDSLPHDGAVQTQNDPSDMENSHWVERHVPTHKNNIAKTKKASTNDFSVDPCPIIDRDTGAGEEDEIRCVNDLSLFEMPSNKVVARKFSDLQLEKNKNSQAAPMLLKEETRAASFDAKYPHNTIENASSKHVEASLIKKEHSLLLPGHPRANMPLDFNIPKLPVGMSNYFEFSSMPGGSTKQVKQEPKDYSVDFGNNAKADTSRGVSLQNANIPITKTNGGQSSGNVNLIVQNDGDSNIIVKPEPVDFTDFSAASVVKVTCAVQTDSESFLELPEHLPIKVPPQGARFKKLVLLHDPNRRLWPVVYHQRHCLNALATGWNSFRKANNIQPGDRCTFSVEDSDEGIFSVQILRR